MLKNKWWNPGYDLQTETSVCHPPSPKGYLEKDEGPWIVMQARTEGETGETYTLFPSIRQRVHQASKALLGLVDLQTPAP